MRNLCLFLLVMSSLLCSSCNSLPTGAQVETWKAQTDKALATAAVLADRAKVLADSAIAKADELKAAQAAQLEQLEAISGPLDKNGDGDVTMSEAQASLAELRKTPEGVDLLGSWETYAAVLASVLGIGVAKKGGSVAVKALHKTGRKLAGPNNGVTT